MSRKKEHEITEAFLNKGAGCLGISQTGDRYGELPGDFREADWLPGLVVDKFSDVLVVESLALGIDRLKPVLLDKLRKCCARRNPNPGDLREKRRQSAAAGRDGAL